MKLPTDSKLITTLVQMIHKMGHKGFYKTIHRLHNMFYWKKNEEDSEEGHYKL